MTRPDLDYLRELGAHAGDALDRLTELADAAAPRDAAELGAVADLLAGLDESLERFCTARRDGVELAEREERDEPHRLSPARASSVRPKMRAAGQRPPAPSPRSARPARRPVDDDQLIPIETAAREARKGREYIRAMIESGELRAYQTAGTDAHPWLKVKMRDVWAAIERRTVYVPPALAAGTPTRRPSGNRLAKLHPAAAAMGRGAAR